VAIDPVHNEVFVPSNGGIMVYRRDKGGDAAPVRMLRGPKTRLTSPSRIAVDPVNNLLVVGNRADPAGLMLFDRTASGDVEPKAVITGPKSGITNASR